MGSTIFFILSKLGWGLIRPATWLMIAAFLGWRAAWRGHARAARRWIGVVLIAMLGLAILPVGDWLLSPLEYRHAPNPPLDQVDGIVILGFGNQPLIHAHTGQIALDGNVERLTEALALTRRFPDARVVFTGGGATLSDPTARDVPPDAVLKGQVLTDLGLAPERLTLETKARITSENARFTRTLMQPQKGETWVLVTSAYHMPRSYESFARAGWGDIIPYPVDFRTAPGTDQLRFNLAHGLAMLDMALHEYAGLAAYRLAGK